MRVARWISQFIWLPRPLVTWNIEVNGSIQYWHKLVPGSGGWWMARQYTKPVNAREVQVHAKNYPNRPRIDKVIAKIKKVQCISTERCVCRFHWRRWFDTVAGIQSVTRFVSVSDMCYANYRPTCTVCWYAECVVAIWKCNTSYGQNDMREFI